MKPPVIFALALLALAGCQTPGSQFATQSHEQLNAAPICCKTIAEARFSNLPVKQTDYKISLASQAFNFDDGKAFFEMYKLPAYAAPYSILIGSVSSGTVEDMAVMALRITLLDENFKPTRHFNESNLRHRGNVFERTVFINPENKGDQYLIIAGSPVENSINETIGLVTTTQINTGAAMFFMPMGRDVKSSLHYAPTGSYFLKVDNLP